MEYRKYRAKTFQEAKLKMLLDVGHHAYIVSQRKVRVGGFFGLFGTLMVEITVGIIESRDRLMFSSAKGSSKNKQESNNIQEGKYNNIQNDNRYNATKPIPPYAPPSNSYKQDKPSQDNNNSSSRESFGRELDEIKSLITMILSDKNKEGKSSFNDNNVNEAKLGDNNNTTNKDKLASYTRENTEGLLQSQELIKLFMKEEDFNDGFIEDFCSLSSIKFLLSNEKKLSVIKEKLRQQIAEVINTSSGIQLNEGKTNVIVLIGPTGVGKTTTLAKLGAYFGVFQKKKVKLLSIDTYRVGAIQQLKLYADIMDIPFAKVNNVREFEMELNMDNYDLILIDTTGRSQRNVDEIRDIKKYLDIIEHNLHISLVISATTKYRDIVEILDKFDILNYTNIIITKLDETNSLGQVISAIRPKNRSLTYVTFGQSVPEDIEEASKNKLFELILKV